MDTLKIEPAAFRDRVNSAAAGFSVGGEHAGGKGESGDDIRLAGLRLLAHSLVGLAAQLGYRVDTFALGPIAQMLGTFLSPGWIGLDF